jgi:DNA-binding transcriptional regulator LsrR (DeoR family)
VKICHLYYEQNCSEEDIARTLSLSRSKVSRSLNQARQMGIVKISIIPPPGFFPALEQALEREFDLREAVVVETSSPDTANIISKDLGIASAHYLRQTIREGDIIGISWGRTLNAMIASLQYQKSMDNQVVQILGGLGEPTAEVHATGLCRRMANALNCDFTLLPASGIVSSPQIKEALTLDRFVQNALQMFSRLNVAYVGIGSPSPESFVFKDGAIMSESDLDELREWSAAGDIALRYYNQRGEAIQSNFDERVIGITLDELKQVNRVVGVAGGADKVGAIRGALLGKLINVLITDKYTAEALLAGRLNDEQLERQKNLEPR